MTVINLSKAKMPQAHLMSVLNKLMEKTQININQICKNTGLAQNTVKRMCTDINSNPTLDSLTKVADFFGVSPNQLLGIEPLPDEANSFIPNFEKWDKIPILSLTQVVDWPKNIDDIKSEISTKYVLTDIEINEETFALIVSDEALEPKFSDGTILIFDAKRSPKNKDIVILIIDEKKLPQFRQILMDGDEMYSKTINPNLPGSGSVRLEANKFTIFGVLIQAKSNFI
jgi:SOS-response transcriptional repressor LexA